MGRIGRFIKAEIDKYIIQTVELYFGANVSAETFAPSGDDSPPIENDRIVLVRVDGTGNFAAVGVLSVSQGAKAGEKILYSRSASGEVKAVLKLLNDGKIEMVSPDELVLQGKKLSLQSKETTLTGGNVKCAGTAVADGTGCFCGAPYCFYSGAPQSGSVVQNA